MKKPIPEKLLDIIKQKEQENTSTLERINNLLYKESNSSTVYKAKPGFRPSSLGTKCPRKRYYQYYRVPEDFPKSDVILRIWETGNYMEEMIAKWLIQIGEHVPFINKGNKQPPIRHGKPDPQFPISDADWRINKGYIDNVDVSSKGIWLHEIKSSKEEKWTPLTEPMAEHIVQTACYVKAFEIHLQNGDYDHIPQLDKSMKVLGVKFFYINKNTSKIKEFIVPRDKYGSIINKLDNLVKGDFKNIDEKKLPKKVEDNCYWCDFRLKCKKNWNKV